MTDKSRTTPCPHCLLPFICEELWHHRTVCQFRPENNNEDYQEQPAVKKRKPVLAASEALLEGILQETSAIHDKQVKDDVID